MATVRITETIRWHVSCNIQTAFGGRISKAITDLDNLHIGQEVYENCVPEKYRKLAAELQADPDGGWLPMTQVVCLYISYTRNGQQTQRSFTSRTLGPVAWPNRYNGGRVAVRQDHPFYAKALAACRAIDAIEDERDETVNSIVNGVLKQCTTLRQVLEFWPSALDFMPPDAVTRHNTVVEKRTVNKPDCEISDDVKLSIMKVRLNK